MNEIRIDKNIPLPPKRRKEGEWAALLKAMSPGDSFLATNRNATTFASLARVSGYSVTTRKTAENEDRPIRVWLVGKAK